MAGRAAQLAKAAIRSNQLNQPMIELRIRATTTQTAGANAVMDVAFDTVDSDAFSGMFRPSDPYTVQIYRSGRATFRWIGKVDNASPGPFAVVLKLNSANVSTEIFRKEFKDEDMDEPFTRYLQAGDRIKVQIDNSSNGSTRDLQAVDGHSPSLELRISAQDGEIL